MVKCKIYLKYFGSFPKGIATNEVFTEGGAFVTSVSEQSLDGTVSATIKDGLRATRQRVDGQMPGQWSIIVTQPDGSHTIQNYNRGRLSRSTRYDVEGSAVSWIEQEYDDSGRVWKTTDSRTGTTTVHYDENGRQWKVSAPNPATGSSTEGTLDNYFHYDALGQLIRTTKPSGGEVHQVYNANGTLHGTHGYHTTDVSYRYNGRGERTHLITYYGPDNRPAATRWAYNARGQLAFKQDAHGKRVHYTYTPGGKLKSRTWARGVATTYHYDADNHLDLRSIDYSDATPDVHFTYTRLGQKHTVEDAGGTTTYTYRAGNPTKLLSETSGTEPELKTLTYTEDDFGRASGFQIGTANDPDQDYAVGYGYDGVGRLANVHAQGYWFDYAYEPNSTTDRVKTLTAPFLKQTVYTHEPGRDALISVSNRVGFQLTEEISRFTYTNNKDGQRIARETLREDDEGYVDRFLYDPDTGGVIASERDGVDEAYAYDKIGNRLRAEANGSERLYTPNALNQYERAGEHRPSHDVDGNLIAQGERTFTWDGENRLIAIHERGSFVATYTYDHQSRRIARRTQDGVDERYLYQGWNLIAVYAPGGVQPTETFTWGKDLSGSLQGAGGVGGLLFAKKRDADQDAWLYHYDANGNVTEVTSASGRMLDHYCYDPFGNLEKPPRLVENRWRFSTKQFDQESGFYYFGYRYFDPGQGRWLSRDPLGEAGGVNLRVYANNDPINRWDLLGLQHAPFEAGVVSYIASFNANTMYNSLDLTQIQNPVLLPALWAGVLGLSLSTNPTPPFWLDSYDWRDTRGALFAEFTVSCDTPSDPSIEVAVSVDSPGATPMFGVYWAAEGIDAVQETGTSAQWAAWGYPCRASKLVKNHSRLGGAGQWFSALATGHGVPYVGRSISLTVDCGSSELQIAYSGTDFPSAAAYLRGLKVSTHSQTNPESLLFGQDSKILLLSSFYRTDWVSFDSFYP